MSKKLLSIDGKLVTVNGKLLCLPDLHDTIYAASLPDVVQYSAGDVCVTGDNAKAYVVDESSSLPIAANAFVWQLSFDGGTSFYPIIYGQPWMYDGAYLPIQNLMDDGVVAELRSLMPVDGKGALYRESVDRTAATPADVAEDFNTFGADCLYSTNDLRGGETGVDLGGSGISYTATSPTYFPNDLNKYNGPICLMPDFIRDDNPAQYLDLVSSNVQWKEATDDGYLIPGLIIIPSKENSACNSTVVDDDFELNGGSTTVKGAERGGATFPLSFSRQSDSLFVYQGGSKEITFTMLAWLCGAAIGFGEVLLILQDYAQNNPSVQNAYTVLSSEECVVALTPYTPGFLSNVDSVQIKQWKD